MASNSNVFEGNVVTIDALGTPASPGAWFGFVYSAPGACTGPKILAGTTSPSGVLTAAKGSLWLRTDGTASTAAAYVNVDGATNWQALGTGSSGLVLLDDQYLDIGTDVDSKLGYTSGTNMVALAGQTVTAGGASAASAGLTINTGNRVKNDTNAGTPGSGPLVVASGAASVTAAATGGDSGTATFGSGAVTASGGGTAGTSGVVLIVSGTGPGATGQVGVLSGASSAGTSGLVAVSSGSGSTGSGALTLSTGTTTTGTTGAVQLKSGIPDAGGSSGTLDVSTGAATGGGTSGSITINTGTAAGGATSGTITLRCGSTSGTRGAVEVDAAALLPPTASYAAPGTVQPTLPIEYTLAVADGATGNLDWTIGRKITITEVLALKTSGAGAGGNSVQVATGAGVAISDAIATTGAVGTLTQAATLDPANYTIAAGGTLRIIRTRAGGDAGAQVTVRGFYAV